MKPITWVVVAAFYLAALAGIVRREGVAYRRARSRTPKAIVAEAATSSHPIAMIFDLDGVLVHSMPLHTRAWEHYLERLGVTIQDLERRMHTSYSS